MQLFKNFFKVLVTALLVTSSTAELIKGTVASANANDELYTFGLSTCIGAAAVGTANQDGGTDKILAHVSAANPDNGDFNQQFDRWEQSIRDSQMTDVKLFLSLPRPDVMPGACRAMGDIIEKAKSTCRDLGIGCVSLERRNEDVEGSPPLGTVLIKANKDVEMEGRKVS
ncbi:hypothetical protein PG997_014104 [Apiospora hydei]|uniref:Uncharacterized protein n=1 Tax=Apiospora hydei TaxID=1337664 RepID=A0ABR1V8Y4_9PEZI